MTIGDKKLIKAYDKFLTEYCRCSADAVGNRPCDNGAICSRCMEKDAQEIWRAIMLGLDK